ncbi:centrosomal protein of 55 kDa isoform X2 [Pseudophryne corroboree]|uniref:centrosomal protein of 55 kDa isoform X2 n=1 Tax=Pseudophryne corroboree TaxID=495146 RepID=UPI003081B89B
MNSRNKLGIRSAVLKSDNELEKLKKENAALKKKLEESSKSKMSEAERNRLLETILDLETQKALAVDMAARKLEKMSKDIRKQLPEVPGRNVESAARVQYSVQDPRKEAASNACVLEAQLKDALEKNQQWLVYDQQREAYVQGLMARIFDLEKQVTNAKQTEEKAKDSNSDVISATEEKQKYYDRLLLTAKKDLEGERQITGQLNSELSAMRMKYEDKKREVGDLSTALKSLRETERQRRDDDRKLYKEKMQKLKNELDVYREKLEEEKVKNAELLNQVELIQKSILRQNEDQKRVAALEEQIQRCTSDLENEKIDRHSVQHQLYKVLKELRKTREQITKLEPVKRDICYVDASSNFVSEFSDKLKVREEHQSPRHNSLLDESFLECPRCRAVYPASQHRELLAHIDFCTS